MTLREALGYHWQTKRELAHRLGTTPRHVEEMVEESRKRGGLPIMSGALGYRYALSPAEYAENIERRKRRAQNQLVTVRGERAGLRRWEARLRVPLSFEWDAA